MRKKEAPTGIIIFLIFIVLEITYRIFFIKKNKLFLGPFFLDKLSTRVFFGIMIIILGIIFYGTIKKKKWTRKIIKFYYISLVFITTINLIFFFISKDKIISFVAKINDLRIISSFISLEYAVLLKIILTLIFQIIITTMILKLIKKHKRYFSN